MEINGKVHCFFEQSDTFKGEFIKLGIPAEDYDIHNLGTSSANSYSEGSRRALSSVSTSDSD